MKLEEIKEQYAKENEFPDWEMLNEAYYITEKDWEQIARRYAKAKLEEAAENAKFKTIESEEEGTLIGSKRLKIVVDKESITNIKLD